MRLSATVALGRVSSIGDLQAVGCSKIALKRCARTGVTGVPAHIDVPVKFDSIRACKDVLILIDSKRV